MADGFAQRAMSALHGAGFDASAGLPLPTERKREILAHAASGQGNKEIADKLCPSLDTVKTHLHHIYQKLHVAGRVEAILLYVKAS